MVYREEGVTRKFLLGGGLMFNKGVGGMECFKKCGPARKGLKIIESKL